MLAVDYYFTPLSPWTYLGHERFLAICASHGAAIRVRPIDLGARVFPVSGGLPLARRAPQRQAYRLVELQRWREWRGVPLNLHPKFFPVPQDDACLTIVAVDQAQGAEAALRAAGAMMRAVWAEDRDVSDPATLAAILREQGLDDSRLDERRAAARPAYDSYTQQAIDAGVFGAPWYQLGEQPFWGQDRLEFLERALAAGATSA